jgi:hypothetical protein
MAKTTEAPEWPNVEVNEITRGGLVKYSVRSKRSGVEMIQMYHPPRGKDAGSYGARDAEAEFRRDAKAVGWTEARAEPARAKPLR